MVNFIFFTMYRLTHKQHDTFKDQHPSPAAHFFSLSRTQRAWGSISKFSSTKGPSSHSRSKFELPKKSSTKNCPQCYWETQHLRLTVTYGTSHLGMRYGLPFRKRCDPLEETLTDRGGIHGHAKVHLDMTRKWEMFAAMVRYLVEKSW